MRRLGELGMSVYLGARDADRGEQAAALLREEGLDVTTIVIDVTDDASIASAADRVRDERGVLDVLVNNAGIAGPNSLPSQTTRDELRAVFETNVFGVVAVTNAFPPLLRPPRPRESSTSPARSHRFRRCSTTRTHRCTFVKELPYPASKTALNMVTGHFAEELSDIPIKVSGAIPGYVAIDLNDNTGHRTPAHAAEIIATLATLPADATTGQYWGSLTCAPDGVHESGRW